MPDYMDDEEDSFPMMAKRKMMKAMKAKRAADMEDEEDYPEMEKEMSLVKVEINVGGSNGKGKK
jgi:hypothetical protein